MSEYLSFLQIGENDLYYMLGTFLCAGLTILYQRHEFKKHGYIFGYYPWSYRIFAAPVYEEVLFRGIIFSALDVIIGVIPAVVVSSFLFGLWHLKNHMHHSSISLFLQISYTGIILGPILAVLTAYTGSIWLAVLVHAANNLCAPIFNKFLKFSYPQKKT